MLSDLVRRIALSALLTVAMAPAPSTQERGTAGAPAAEVNLDPITKSPVSFTVTDKGRIYNMSVLGQTLIAASNFLICNSNAADAPALYAAWTMLQTNLYQPHGPGTLPLSITTESDDGAWRLKHTYTLSPSELELIDTVVITRLGASLPSAALTLTIDDWPGIWNQNVATKTNLGTFQTSAGQGALSTALTRLSGTTIRTAIRSSILSETCSMTSLSTPTAPGDVNSNITYAFDNGFAAGKSKTVKFQLRRN